MGLFRIKETTGSSPHVRGARLNGLEQDLSLGIIPTCAGSTRRGRSPGRGRRNHPRICGEHLAGLSACPSTMGSSPHVRGARGFPRVGCANLRIIPACAGSTSHGAPRSTRAWDHPRMRGEHSCSLMLLMASLGSSSHARGARKHNNASALLGRIIPACAGSTPSRCRGRFQLWDHPRMRGEHGL